MTILLLIITIIIIYCYYYFDGECTTIYPQQEPVFPNNASLMKMAGVALSKIVVKGITKTMSRVFKTYMSNLEIAELFSLAFTLLFHCVYPPWF